MGTGGIAPRSIAGTGTSRPASVLEVDNAVSYRSSARVAIELRLRLTARAGSTAWEAAGAALIGPGGRELPVLEVWQEAPVTPGQERVPVVMVEAEALPSEAQGTFTLKLWDRGGTSTVTLTGVTFPPLPGVHEPP